MIELDPSLLPESAAIDSSHISVYQFGAGLMTCPFRKRVHRHTMFEVVWLAKGELSLFIDFASHHLESGSLLFISPGQIHALDGREDVDLTIVCFSADLFSLYGNGFEFLANLPFYYTTFPPLLTVEPEQQVEFNQLFGQIRAKYQTKKSRLAELLCSYLNIVFLESVDLYEGTPPATTYPATKLAHNFRLAAEKYFIKRMQVQDYAELLGITSNHLIETVRTVTGMTPGQILKERLALEAKRLLVHTADSSAEIAYRLAFKNPSQFGRWFRNTEGVTPGQFREQFTVPNALAPQQ